MEKAWLLVLCLRGLDEETLEGVSPLSDLAVVLVLNWGKMEWFPSLEGSSPRRRTAEKQARPLVVWLRALDEMVWEGVSP